MLFETSQDCCPVEIVLEQFNLSRIGQVVTSRIEGEDIHARLHYHIHILIQSLLRGQLPAPWEVIVELAVLHNLVSVLLAVCEFPLDIVQIASMGHILDPASGLRSPFDVMILGVEA